MLNNIILMVFASAFFSTIAVYVILRNRLGAANRNIKKRLDDLSSYSGDDEGGTSYSILRDDKLSHIPFLNRMLQRFSFTRNLKRLITQAGVSINVGTLILGILSLGGLAFLVTLQYSRHALAGLVVGIVVGIMPLMYLTGRRRKRRDQFEALLPDALDLITNALKSGFSFETAMKMVAQEVSDPLGFEFAMTLEEQNLGVNFAETLFNLRARVPSDDLDLFITALLIHKRTGGNLAEVLDKTAGTIRDRFKLKREIKTKTAHGRFSGLVLVLLPLGMIAMLLVTNPDYFMVLIEERVGNYLLASAIVMQIIGIWVIKKIIDIKI